jgi:hypothetical protein
MNNREYLEYLVKTTQTKRIEAMEDVSTKIVNHIPSIYQNTEKNSYLYNLENNIKNKIPSSMYIDLGTKNREECTSNHVGFLGYNPRPTCKKFEELVATVTW